MPTTRECGKPLKDCLVTCRPRTKRRHEASPRYQCEWVDWVCVPQKGAHQRLSEHRGQMIVERNPAVAAEVVDQLSYLKPLQGCLQELRATSVLLDMQGFQWRPSWVELRDGKRPPECSARDPGEWPHCWQYWASSILDSRFWKLSMLAGQSAARQATIQPHLFQVQSTCSGCHETLDPLGYHRNACSHSGRIQRRATPIERVMARICREAGARVKFNALLRVMNVRVASCDARRI